MTHNCKIHFRASNFYRQITNGLANLAPPKVQVASRQSAIAYGRVLRGISSALSLVSRSWTGSQRCQGGQMVSRQTDRPADVAHSAHSQGTRCRWPMPQAINHLNMPKKNLHNNSGQSEDHAKAPRHHDNWQLGSCGGAAETAAVDATRRPSGKRRHVSGAGEICDSFLLIEIKSLQNGIGSCLNSSCGCTLNSTAKAKLLIVNWPIQILPAQGLSSQL